MKKETGRKLGIIAAFAILIGAFFVSRLLSEMKEPPKRRDAFSKKASVEVLAVANETIPTTLNVQGDLIAYDKIDIFAEVSGTLEETSRPFKVGSYFPKGSVLIRVDDEEARLSILSQKSNLLNSITQLMPDLKIDYPQSYEHWNEYLKAFDMQDSIRAFPDPASDQEKYFIASRNLYSQYYEIRSAEERLSKYTIEAPFGGVITSTSINPGALVRSGQKLGELMSTGIYELEATVPLSELKYIQTGNKVILTSDDIDGQWTGRIKRINDQVDPDMQTVKVFIDVQGRDLKEGMYLKGEVAATDIRNAVQLPRNLLVDQKAVYVVQDSVLRLREVNVVKITKEAAIVRGLPEGTWLLSDPLPNAFDGMKVEVTNKEESAATEQSGPETAPVGG